MSFLCLPSQTSVGKCQHFICHQQQSTPLFFLNHHHLRCPPTPHHQIHPWPPPPTTLVDHPQWPWHTATQQQPRNTMSPTIRAPARLTWRDEHHLMVMTCHVITVWLFSATPVSKKPPQPPHCLLSRCHVDSGRHGHHDKWWWCTDNAVTQTTMRAHLPHERQWGPTTTTDKRQRGPPPCTNSNEHPAPAHTRRGQDRDDDDMAQWQTMTRLPHDNTTPTNDTWLGDDNTCKDDNEGHVPLAFYIPLPFIPSENGIGGVLRNTVIIQDISDMNWG